MARLERYYRNKSMWESAQSFLDLLYICTVREFRGATGGALLGFLSVLMRPMLLFVVFYIIYEIIGRTAIIRGDFMVFMMTGIFLYLNHIQAVKNLKSSGHAQGGMIFYAKTSTLLTIFSSAVSELYIMILSVLTIMTTAYLVRGYLDIYNPIGLMLPFFIAWLSGLAVGLLFLAISPIAPGMIQMLFMLYRRVQMFTSGKMFLANTIPPAILPFFAWNPLFHCIDQARDAAFINYVARNTNMEYPVYLTIALFVVGMIIEFAFRVEQSRGMD